MIDIITNGRCPRCKQLHEFLKSKGFPVGFKYVSEGIDIPKEMGTALPIVKIKDKWIKYNPLMVQTVVDEYRKTQENTKGNYPKKDS